MQLKLKNVLSVEIYAQNSATIDTFRIQISHLMAFEWINILTLICEVLHTVLHPFHSSGLQDFRCHICWAAAFLDVYRSGCPWQHQIIP